MTALEETGVKLTAQNETGFVSAMGRSQTAVSRFLQSVGTGSTQLGQFNVAGMTVASTIGNLAAGAIERGAGAILDLGAQGISAAANLQTLTVSLETLAAREQLTTGAADDMNTALEQSGPIAQDLLGQLRKISVISPFEYQDITRIFQLNVAFGQTTDMSLKLTKAITDVGAAAGKSGYDLERIAYNFSQMSMTGKVSMRDVRDLALAGVDLSRVLREQLGMSIDEVNDALEAGKITMEDVSTAFVQYAETNFGGAAQRMSRTFTGLISSFKDLAYFSSIDLFGPGLQTVADKMGTVFDRIQQFIDSGALKTAGADLDTFITDLFSLGEAAVTASGMLDQSLEQTFLNMESKGFAWGYNIINQVVGGMLQGAIDSVGTLTQIGAWLGSWFEPGSPPKILPDLDVWGMEAMNVYLEGWTKGDFSVFEEISGIVERSLRATAGTKDTGIIPSILGSREAIQTAIDQVRKAGMVTDDILQNLFQTVGAGNPAMQNYLAAALGLSLANDKVAKAQAELNAVTKKYDDLLAPLNAKVQGATDAQDTLTDLQRISQMQLVLTDVNATAADKEMARLEIEKLQAKTQIRAIEAEKTAAVDAAQDKVDAATAEQVAMQEKADLAKAMIQMRTDENDLLRQQVALLEQLANAAKKAAGAGAGAGGYKLPKVTAALPENVPTTNLTPGQFVYGENSPFGQLQGPTISPFQSLIDKIDELKNKLGELQAAWQPVTDVIGKNIGPTLAAVAAFVATNAVLGALAPLLLATINPVTALMLAISLLVAVIVRFGAQAASTVQMAWFIFMYYLSDTAMKLHTYFDEWGTYLSGWWENFSFLAHHHWERFKETVVTKAGEIWDEIKKFANNIVQTFTDKITELKQVGSDIVGSLWQGMKDNWSKFKAWLDEQIAKIPKVIRDAIGMHSPAPSLVRIGEGVGNSIRLGLQKTMGDLRSDLGTMATMMVDVPGSAMVAPPSVSHTYAPQWNLTVMTNNNPEVVQQSFGVMRILAA